MSQSNKTTETTETRRPIPPRLLTILSDGQWKSRSQIAAAMAIPYGINAAVIAALIRLKKDGEIEAEYRSIRGDNKHWVYRITAKGRERLIALILEDAPPLPVDPPAPSTAERHFESSDDQDTQESE